MFPHVGIVPGPIVAFENATIGPLFCFFFFFSIGLLFFTSFFGPIVAFPNTIIGPRPIVVFVNAAIVPYFIYLFIYFVGLFFFFFFFNF